MTTNEIGGSHLTDDWGWFVDIDTTFEPTIVKTHLTLSIPKTIYEYPKIQIIQPVNSLHKLKNIFIEHNTQHYVNNIIHIMGIFGVVLCCCIIYL